jgi:hypothetical protein
LGDSIDTILAPCLQVEQSHDAETFGKLRAFLSWDERTCQTQTHVHRMLNTWTWPTIRAQPANCRECSRSVHHLFIVVLCVFWGIDLLAKVFRNSWTVIATLGSERFADAGTRRQAETWPLSRQGRGRTNANGRYPDLAHSRGLFASTEQAHQPFCFRLYYAARAIKHR